MRMPSLEENYGKEHTRSGEAKGQMKISFWKMSKTEDKVCQ